MMKLSRFMMFFTVLAAASAPLGSATAGGDRGTFEITPLVGYQVGGSFDLDGAHIDLDSALSYGGMLGIRLSDHSLITMSYHRQSTNANLTVFDPSIGIPSQVVPIDIDYLQIGGELDMLHRSRLSPLFGITIGATRFSPEAAGSEANWFFSGIIYGGATFRIAKHVGLRAQARFLGTVISSNSRWLCSSQGGCAITVADTEGVMQGDFSIGAYVSF